MSNAQQAADDIKSLSNRFKGIIQVGEALEKIGSIENAEKEALKRKDEAVRLADEAESALVDKRELLGGVQIEIDKATEKADKTVSDANAKAQDIVKNAESKAAGIIEEAKKKKVGILDEIRTERETLENLQSSVKSTQDELSTLTKQLDDLKAKLSAFIK